MMKLRSFYLPDELYEKFRALSKTTEKMNISDHVREALLAYMKEKNSGTASGTSA